MKLKITVPHIRSFVLPDCYIYRYIDMSKQGWYEIFVFSLKSYDQEKNYKTKLRILTKVQKKNILQNYYYILTCFLLHKFLFN